MNEKRTAQERICEEIKALYHAHINGQTNKELAVHLGTTETNICRDMAVLAQYNWVVRDEDARWRLSPIFGGIAGQIMKSYQTARLKLSEEEAKYMSAMQ